MRSQPWGNNLTHRPVLKTNTDLSCFLRAASFKNYMGSMVWPMIQVTELRRHWLFSFPSRGGCFGIWGKEAASTPAGGAPEQAFIRRAVRSLLGRGPSSPHLSCKQTVPFTTSFKSSGWRRGCTAADRATTGGGRRTFHSDGRLPNREYKQEAFQSLGGIPLLQPRSLHPAVQGSRFPCSLRTGGLSQPGRQWRDQ